MSDELLVSRRSLPPIEDIGALLWRMKDFPHVVAFDGGGAGEAGRFSMIAVGARERLRWSVGDPFDPFTAIEDLLRAHQVTAPRDLPFVAGLMGWIGYEARHVLECLPGRDPCAGELPDVWLAESRLTLVLDHRRGTAQLVRARSPSPSADETGWSELEAAVLERLENPAIVPPVRMPPRHLLHPPSEDHRQRVRQVRELITEGEVYQVNLGQAFRLPRPPDALATYRALRASNPAPFGAFVDLGEEGALISSSPERFLELRAGRVVTRPIKGTIARGSDAASDAVARHELSQSAKDRAELAMIVDVLRNDLARVARLGSVVVDRAMEVETHPSVHHLVAQISAELDTGQTAVDLLRASFPGGSITGAPRIRAMELIEELEDFRRGPWCGSFLHLGYDGSMDSNILIRTLFTRGEEMLLPGGGGITIDSDPEREHQECLDKIAGLERALARGAS